MPWPLIQYLEGSLLCSDIVKFVRDGRLVGQSVLDAPGGQKLLEEFLVVPPESRIS